MVAGLSSTMLPIRCPHHMSKGVVVGHAGDGAAEEVVKPLRVAREISQPLIIGGE